MKTEAFGGPTGLRNTATETEPGAKEKAIFVIKHLLELIESDRVRADQIQDMTAAEIIALAETEAAKAVEGSERLEKL